ncbi:MAG: 3-dehydroquinate synthase [Planctomycetota bacterium]
MIELNCHPEGQRPGRILIRRGIRCELRQRTAERMGCAVVDRRAGLEPASLPRSIALFEVDGGEHLKSFAWLEKILRGMASLGLDRKSLLVAIGGGTVGDAAGLAAALYLRGIECWQVPTTFLSMVDSSVGGKTAIDLPEGKNLVGAFHAPSLVLVDPEFAQRQSDEQFRSGLAEAVKVAIGLDPDLFRFLAERMDRVLAREIDAVTEVARASIAAKIEIVERDPVEAGPRRLLNLGHTLGHALEARARGSIPHGHCVARGLHFALDLAERMGAIAAADANACRDLLRLAGFQGDAIGDVEGLLPFLRRDKKSEGGAIHFALPTGIGRSRIEPIAVEILERELRA